MDINKSIPDLIQSNVISQETADNILSYYQNKKGQSSNRLLMVFGIIGAILIGLGIILILAHNWDEIPKWLKTIFAFLPLVIGQSICGYTLFKKPESAVFRESSTAFLIFAIGSSISLIGQIYNIPGSINSFLLTWTLLSLPLVYIMKSSIGSLLYLIGISFYGGEVGYDSHTTFETYLFWILLLGIAPHYFHLLKHKANSNALSFHNWLIPTAIVILLGTISKENGQLLFITYSALFGLLYIIGEFDFLKNAKLRNNGFKILGLLGQIVVIYILSFHDLSEEIFEQNLTYADVILSLDFIVGMALSAIALVILFLQNKGKDIKSINPLSIIFSITIGVFLIGFISSTAATILFNFLLLSIGILTIRKGAIQDNLGILNFGLLTVSFLIVSRFFDMDISFVLKGITFVALGIGFFFTNYLIIKKRKSHENK